MSDQRSENPMDRYDKPTMLAIQASDGGLGAPRTNFLPSTFGEALEMAKIMCAGNFVPAHLRGKPGDCLAVVMQASRWGMDPFAVANKTYFVNDRMAYESQLVAAVVNSSGVLDGRLDVEWFGAGDELSVVVTGKLKGDAKNARPKVIEQHLKTISTRNSPLWKQAPRQQLGYYGQRLWARLYAPEVLLGVYTVEEIEEIGPDNARDVPGNRRLAPTRSQVTGGRNREAEPEAERVVEPDEVIYDTSTGEVIDDETEEEINRRLDAEQAAQERGLDEAEEEEEEEEPTPERTAAAVVEPEPVVEQPKAAESAKPVEIDWQAWLTKFTREIGKMTDIDAVNAHYANKADKLSKAPEGIKNRARAARDAQLRKLAPPRTTTTEPARTEPKQEPEVKAAAATKTEKAAEPATEAVKEPAPDDGASPATAKADEIIADLNRAELLMDLRTKKLGHDPDIDAMDEENAGRVMRAYRALEDKLMPKRNG